MEQLRFRSVTRVATRALLVAGFAGAAWLLSSAAAHAAAPAPTTAPGTDQGVVSLTAPVTHTAVDLLGAVLTPRSETTTSTAPQRGTVRATSPVPSVLNLLSPLTGVVAHPGTGL